MSAFIVADAFSSLKEKDSLPLEHEKLQEPFKLNAKCFGSEIIEWRGTKNKPHTDYSADKANIINNYCNAGAENISAFLKTRLNIDIDFSGIKTKLYFMPGNVHDHGKDFRNLNDIKFRFKDRRTQAKYVWGYTSVNGIFIFNDVVSENNYDNDFFELVFLHELFHEIVTEYKLYNYIAVDVNEEFLANEFAKFVMNRQ